MKSLRKRKVNWFDLSTEIGMVLVLNMALGVKSDSSWCSCYPPTILDEFLLKPRSRTDLQDGRNPIQLEMSRLGISGIVNFLPRRGRPPAAKLNSPNMAAKVLTSCFETKKISLWCFHLLTVWF